MSPITSLISKAQRQDRTSTVYCIQHTARNERTNRQNRTSNNSSYRREYSQPNQTRPDQTSQTTQTRASNRPSIQPKAKTNQPRNRNQPEPSELTVILPPPFLLPSSHPPPHQSGPVASVQKKSKKRNLWMTRILGISPSDSSTNRDLNFAYFYTYTFSLHLHPTIHSETPKRKLARTDSLTL